MPFTPDRGSVTTAGLQGGWDALAALIAERKKDELLRYTQEQDRQQFQLTQRKMDETSKWQQLQYEALENERRSDRAHQAAVLKGIEDERKRQEANRVADNMRAKWEKTAGNTLATPQEFIEATQQGDVARGAFTPEKIPIDPTTGTAVEGIPQQFRYEGGASWQAGEEMRKLREKAMQNPQMIPVKWTNPTTGVEETIMIDKRQTSHFQSIGPTAVPPGQATKAVDAQVGLHGVADIAATYRPEFVGPAQGWLTKIGTITGYTADVKKLLEGASQAQGGGIQPISEEFAAFVSAVNANKNRTIREITGAALGGTREERRIMGEIPEYTDPPKLFLGKLARIEAERRFLLNTIVQRQMAGLDTPGFGPGATLIGEDVAPPTAAPRRRPRVTRITPGAGGGTGKVRLWERDANGNLIPGPVE